MKHPSDEELLRLLDRELSARETTVLQEHLAGCPACRERHHGMADTSSDLKRLLEGAHPLPSPDPGRAILRRRMEEVSGSSDRLQPPQYRWIFGAAAAALIIATLVVLPRPQPSLETRAVPDPALTPGATLPVTREEICSIDPDEITRPVPPGVAHAVFAAYGIDSPPARAYEVDYLITPALGGSDSVRNFWPQAYRTSVWNAHTKDALEDRLHALVCSGDVDLATAQQEIARDWIAAYKKYFRTSTPLPEHAQFLKDRPWE